MALTDAAARKAKPGETDYKLADGGGLYLYVTRNGAKSWRMKYRFAGKEKRLTFGLYPEVSLVEARDRRDAARRLLRDHIDPALERMKLRASATASSEMTFEKVARAWHKAQEARWSPVHRWQTLRAFERDVFPYIGALPVRDIDGPMVLTMLRRIEARGAIDTAKRIRQHVSGVFVFGMSEGVAATDPAATVGKALLPIPRKGRQPALTDIAKARKVLVDVEAATAGPLTKLASRLLALTAVRPGIVRAATWTEFEDLEPRFGVRAGEPVQINRPLWRIPAARMKLELELKDEEAFDHLVPLSRQAVEVIETVARLTGAIELLFPGVRSNRRPMSLNTLGYAYNRVGYQGRHVPHGWRSTFSTVMNERAAEAGRDSDRAVIDGMLAHKPKGVSGSEMAYNRATHMPRRIELAQEWADLLLEGVGPADALLGGAR
jgi:integrase